VTALDEPVIAAWMRSGSEFSDTAYKVLRRLAHRTGFHGARAPLYALRLALMAPRGLYRTGRAAWHLVFDYEAKPLRLHHVDRTETAEYVRLRKMRDERVKTRLTVAVSFLVALAVAAMVSWALLPHWVSWAVLVAVVEVFGWIGRPVGKPIAAPASLVPGAPGPLKAPMVMEALCSLGIGGMRSPSEIGLLFDVARVGQGYQCDLELPKGVDAASVLEKRSQLSAALRRELGTVWPSVGRRHQGHLCLFVGDQSMSQAKQARWPLLKDGAVNVFAPAPFATDQQGRWVNVTLAYTSWIIGAQPRLGKTFAVRELLLLAGLDPRCKVAAIDLKGTGDLAPTALFADFYSVGDEAEDIEAQLDYLRMLRREMRRRARVIRELPHTECPENKVTDALASRTDLGLEPIVVGADEVQVWFTHEDKAIREEFTSICTDLTKRGPALGIWLILATQRPSAKAIPAEISDNAIMRFALKVQGQVANDMILGTSSYQAGVRATLFSFEDRGVGILKGDGAEPIICRTVHGLDAPTAEKVATRARANRANTGRLTGMAAGELMERAQRQIELLEDLRTVVAGPTAHLGDMVALLGELRPGVYGHLDPGALGAMLRAAGVSVATVWDGSKPREQAAGKGIRTAHLDSSMVVAHGETEDATLRLVGG